MYMDTNLISELRSHNATRIYLPYNWTKADDESQWAITQVVMGSGIDLEEISDIKVFAMLKPGKSSISSGFQIVVTATNGRSFSKRIAAEVAHENACKTLESFFTAKAPGLKANYRLFFDGFLTDYKRVGGCQQSNIALNTF